MIELIPAIDIIDGKCVRLTQGDYATKKIYNESSWYFCIIEQHWLETRNTTLLLCPRK